MGVTDGEWYQFLASRPALNEVNFWRPSSKQRFQVLKPGEPFFFKTHHPHNRIVGGGFFSEFVQLRVSVAWELLSEANGLPTLDAMCERIGGYRDRPIDVKDDPVIGCVFVRDTRFFAPDEEAAPPPDFAPNIVQGKSYDITDSRYAPYFGDLLSRLLGHRLEADLTQPWTRPGPVFGEPRLSPQRLGQGSFKLAILRAYDCRCAITGSRVRPALQAAHIRPVTKKGEHRVDNGLLLRSDVHTMFDRGYLGVDLEHRLMVSPRLHAEFDDGDEFYARSGQLIAVPPGTPDRPSREFLEWHLENVYKAL